jgi:hypothetical protein
LVRYSLGVVCAVLFLIAAVDLSTSWRTRDAADRAVTAVLVGATRDSVDAGASSGTTSDCTTVAAGAVEPADLTTLCRAKEASGLDDLDVRIRVETTDDVTVACAMAHHRSTTGLLGRLVDRVTTAQRVDRRSGASHHRVTEAPFPGRSWSFCIR